MGREMKEYQWHIEWRDPNELIPYDGNAKLHDGRNVSNIAASIKKYGWQSYLVITKGGIIIIGHGRRLAAIELGCKCPCKVIEDDLTDQEIRELRIADNKTNESGWDWATLEKELEDLDFSDFDFGFTSVPSEESLDELFAPIQDDMEAKQAEEEEKEIQCPHCKMWFTP